jgi:aspartyl-tRNA synthetase
MLVENAKNKGVNVDNLKEYIDSFKYGSPKHGGGGFGLERITMFFLGIDNIRLASLFPNYYTNV